jgi:hypothetical protein
LRPIDAYASLPRPLTPQPYAATAESGAGFASEAETATVLPRLRPIRSLPFLAQYLAQEIVEPGEPTPRWNVRDSAYRLAGATAVPQRLDLAV